MARSQTLVLTALCTLSALAFAAETVPTDVQQPGTQPGDVSSLQAPDKCDNCHGDYDASVEPAHNWRGSMMAHSARDPLFWAAVAVAEQDFDGAGDFCLRCHTPDGWVSGRSTPTDGSGLIDADADGVACDLCHTMVDPDDSEHLGEHAEPFVAQDPSTGEAYRSSGMYVLWGGSEKMGPYDDAWARHQFLQSQFHRSVSFCATCHDISNPAVGDLSPTHGAQDGNSLDTGSFSGEVGSDVTTKAAFNNLPFAYGVVERTFTEHLASAWPSLAVSDYASLPAELQAGSVEDAYEAAIATGTGGDYADGTTRTFTCQTCHMRPVQGKGADKRGAPLRLDLPLHDLTGGNYWTPDAILYQDSQGDLLFQGTLDSSHHQALTDGQQRAYDNLSAAATLSVSGDTATVVNLTGHKLISGYPEGRRMWLAVTWYGEGDTVLREDGAYGALSVTLDGSTVEVETLLDLEGTNTRIWEAHYGMSQAWAARLVELGVSSELALAYDRATGATTLTLGDLAAEHEGASEETFHFVLNDVVVSDTRIPPYGYDHDTAQTRNALPVPDDQYGDPGAGGTYEHWDEVTLSPPEGAVWAQLELKYQPTSWEYVQFLHLANDGSVAFLADEGALLLEAWLATGMATPYTMATATWGTPSCDTTETACDDGMDDDCDGATDCDDTDCAGDAACETSLCDGDGVCDEGEDCETCPSECDGVLSGKKSARYCCGNGEIEPAEDGTGVCDGNP